MKKKIVRAAAVAGALALAFQARADLFWAGTSGNWNDPVNWSNTSGGAGGAGIPSESEFVYVLLNDAVNRTILLTPSNDVFKVGRVEVSAVGTGTLLFNLTQGTFANNWNWQLWGNNGQAAVVQTGGVNLIDQMELGSNIGAVGTYDLHAGTVEGGPLMLAPHGGQGIFRQSGGRVNVQGLFVSSNSRYEIGSGSLHVNYNQTHSEALAVGTDSEFIQSGGSVVTNQLSMYGRYQWIGGTLQVQEALRIGGRFDFPTSPASLHIDGLVDLTSPTMELNNAQNVSLSLSETSLLVRPTSLDPQTTFGTYSNPGFTHIPGNTLTVPAGRTLNLLQDMDDRIEVHGTLGTIRMGVHLNGGIVVGVNGLVNTKGGNVLIKSGSSQVQGSLQTTTLEVDGPASLFPSPVAGPTLAQTGGNVVVYSLTIGRTGSGTYLLSGGSLSAETTQVGRGNHAVIFPSANMIQTGGVHSIQGSLEIGFGSPIPGNYILGGGRLEAQSIEISGLHSFGPSAPSYGIGRLDVTDASSEIRIARQLAFGPFSTYTAVSGTTIHMTEISSMSNMNIDPAALSGLEHTTFIFEGGADVLGAIEAAGEDFGLAPEGFTSNFVIDTLQIGGLKSAAIELLDLFDNNPAESSLPDALYVKHLVLNAGSSLNLNDIQLYAQQFTNNGGTLLLTGSGQLHVVPEPAVVWPAIAVWALAWRSGRRDGRRQ